MTRIRIDRPKARPSRARHDVAPLDPRDPDIQRAKALPPRSDTSSGARHDATR
jgi:hypothetical protein